MFSFKIASLLEALIIFPRNCLIRKIYSFFAFELENYVKGFIIN
jgi:hypothetical protein